MSARSSRSCALATSSSRRISSPHSLAAVRGVDRDWVAELYSFAVHPDITFYFRVPSKSP